MKRGLVFLGLVLFVGYAAVSTVCGASGSVAGGNPPIDCPDGMEPHRASQRFHGYTFDTSPGCECLEGSDFCVDWSGTVNAINHDEASWDRCGTGMWGVPNRRHSLCAADGWATVWWDGNPSWVCVEWGYVVVPCS